MPTALHPDPLFDVRGRQVLITGGTRGIGLMIAEGLVARGADVTVVSRDPAACREAEERLGTLGSCRAIAADLSADAEIDRVISELTNSVGRLDVLVNNAGATWGAPIDDYPMSGFDKVFDLNVRSVFHLSQAALPLLTAEATAAAPSRIINVGSIDGLTVPTSHNYAYSASKAAVHHLTRHLAKDLASRYITANSIAPGPFYSKMMAFVLDDADIRAKIEASIPLGRIGVADDMIGAAVYLSSQASAYVTGATLVVDGGSVGCR